MTLQDDIRAYQARWEAIEDIIQQEHRSATVELRWKQLNSAYGLAKALGLLRPDPSEAGVIERWAKLKEKAAKLPPKT